MKNLIPSKSVVLAALLFVGSCRYSEINDEPVVVVSKDGMFSHSPTRPKTDVGLELKFLKSGDTATYGVSRLSPFLMKIREGDTARISGEVFGSTLRFC